MKPTFDIKSDLEFYCFLKVNLPQGYNIISEPNKLYFCEWDYCYKLFYKDEFLMKFTGNFQHIKKGSLVRKAKKLFKKYRAEPC